MAFFLSMHIYDATAISNSYSVHENWCIVLGVSLSLRHWFQIKRSVSSSPTRCKVNNNCCSSNCSDDFGPTCVVSFWYFADCTCYWFYRLFVCPSPMDDERNCQQHSYGSTFIWYCPRTGILSVSLFTLLLFNESQWWMEAAVTMLLAITMVKIMLIVVAMMIWWFVVSFVILESDDESKIEHDQPQSTTSSKPKAILMIQEDANRKEYIEMKWKT